MAYVDRFGMDKETFSNAAFLELQRLKKEDSVLANIRFEIWLSRFYDNGTEIVLKDDFSKGKSLR